MAINDPILFITIEEFKTWKGFDPLLFDNVTNSDQNIYFAIAVASNNIDYFSGFAISKKWPEVTPTTFTDNVQSATAHYVRYLCTKGVDYTQGQASMAQGGIVYSESNPDDPYFVPPEVFNYLRKINSYSNIKGYNLANIQSQNNNFFNKFVNNYHEDGIYNQFAMTNNLLSKDSRVKWDIVADPSKVGQLIYLDTTAIKDMSNLLIQDVCKFFDPEIFGIVNFPSAPGSKIITIDEIFLFNLFKVAKFTQEWSGILNTTNKTIIGAINEVNDKKLEIEDIFKFFSHERFEIIVETEGKKIFISDEFLFSLLKEARFTQEWSGILNTNNKTIIGAINEVNDKTSTLTDYYNKNEIDNLLLNKQNLLTSGQNIIIENNVIRAPNNANLSDYYNKNEIDNLKSDLLLQLETITTQIQELKHPWKEVGQKINNRRIEYNFIENRTYRVFYYWNTADKSKKDLDYTWKISSFTNVKADQKFTLDSSVFPNLQTGLYVSANAVFISSTNTLFAITNSEEGRIVKLEEYKF